MPIPTREELKAYLETGDTPTQSQFGEIIDAIYDLAQAAQDTADAAVATVATLQAKAARCYGVVEINTVSTTPGYTVIKVTDCTVVVAQVFSAGFRYNVTVTITPDDDFDDDDFVFLPFLEQEKVTALTTHGMTITRAVNEVVLTFQVDYTSVTDSKIFQFAIFD